MKPIGANKIEIETKTKVNNRGRGRKGNKKTNRKRGKDNFEN
jgi:hypothetical protein